MQGAKFNLVKTMFNPESVTCRLSQSIYSDFGAIHTRNVCRSKKSPKNPYKPLYWRLRSLLLVPIKSQWKTSY